MSTGSISIIDEKNSINYDVLADPENLKRYKAARKEAEEGKGRIYSAEEIMQLFK